MNQPYFFSGDDQNIKSATNVVPTFPFSPFALLHTGPRPTMSSAVSESVNGLRNTISFSHSHLLPLNSFAPPISISSQSLITVNSTATEGPRLKSPPGMPHSPAAPIIATQRGSLSFSAAAAPWADANNVTANPRIAKVLFILPP